VSLHLLDRLLERHARTVGTVADHRVHRVSDGEQPRAQRDLRAAQAARVAHAVPALVVGDDDLPRDRRETGSGDQSLADLGMLAHDVDLAEVEWAGLEEHRVRHTDLADIVEQEAEGDLRIGREGGVDHLTQRDAERRDALDVATGDGVAGVDRTGERRCRRLVRVRHRVQGDGERGVDLLDLGLRL
jgi:hypothetical protein